MKKELFKRRKFELFEVIKNIKRLPNKGEYYFTDGEDMYLWYEAISKLGIFDDYLREIHFIIDKYDIKTLSDNEKKEQFLNYLSKNKHIPLINEASFSDESDMYTWYTSYRNIDSNFENIVSSILPEFQNIDLDSIWSLIEEDFINILKQLKRPPRYREVYLHDIDVRVIYDKIAITRPHLFEQILLHFQTYKRKKLTIVDRVSELKRATSILGYIPYLQEVRFSDGTDMFTWYLRYTKKMPGLEEELSPLIKDCYKKHNPNIYSIPQFKNKEGKFYELQTNEGEVLDLSNIVSQEQLQNQDDDTKGRTR